MVVNPSLKLVNHVRASSINTSIGTEWSVPRQNRWSPGYNWVWLVTLKFPIVEYKLRRWRLWNTLRLQASLNWPCVVFLNTLKPSLLPQNTVVFCFDHVGSWTEWTRLNMPFSGQCGVQGGVERECGLKYAYEWDLQLNDVSIQPLRNLCLAFIFWWILCDFEVNLLS